MIRPYKRILVISGQWEGDNERLRAMARRPSQAGLEPETAGSTGQCLT